MTLEEREPDPPASGPSLEVLDRMVRWNEAWRGLDDIPWGTQEAALLEVLKSIRCPVPIKELVQKLYRPRWSTRLHKYDAAHPNRRRAYLTPREQRTWDRLVERLRGVRRRINQKLEAHGNPLNVERTGEGDLMLCLPFRFESEDCTGPPKPQQDSSKDATPQNKELSPRIRELNYKGGAGSKAAQIVQDLLGEKISTVANCVVWLEEELQDGRPVDVAALNEWATKEGFTLRTLRRARAVLGIDPKKQRTRNGGWRVSLSR
jgi:hypothetical protein